MSADVRRRTRHGGVAEEVGLGGPVGSTVKLGRPKGTVLRTFRWEVSI